MPALNPGQFVLDAVTIAALVTFLVNILKPLVELGIKPGNPAHDSAIQALAVLLNVAANIGVVAATGNLTASGLPVVIGMAIMQASGSIGAYHVLKATPGVTTTTTPTAVPPAPAPVPTVAITPQDVAPVAAPVPAPAPAA